MPNVPGTAVPGFHIPPLRGWSLDDSRDQISLERPVHADT